MSNLLLILFKLTTDQEVLIWGVAVIIFIIFSIYKKKKLNNKRSLNGVYYIKDGVIKPLHKISGNGSINDMKIDLGYSKERVHTILNSKFTTCQYLVVNQKTLKLLFFEVLDKTKHPLLKDIYRFGTG